MSQPKNAQSGFSLIEMLVAVVILAVGLLGLAQLQVTAMKTNAQSATSTAASALAQRILEEISAMDPKATMFNGPSTNTTWTGSPFTIAGAGVYNVTYDVEQVEDAAGDPLTNLYKIKVTVESDTNVSFVDRNAKRKVVAYTLKRAK